MNMTAPGNNFSPSSLENLNCSDFYAFAKEKLGEDIADKLQEEEIDGPGFLELTEEDLYKKMGFKLGTTKRILRLQGGIRGLATTTDPQQLQPTSQIPDSDGRISPACRPQHEKTSDVPKPMAAKTFPGSTKSSKIATQEDDEESEFYEYIRANLDDECTATLIDNQIDKELFVNLTSDEIKELFQKLGSRKRVELLQAQLKTSMRKTPLERHLPSKPKFTDSHIEANTEGHNSQGMYNQNPTFAGMGSNPLMSPQHAIQPTPISMLQQYPAPGLGLPLHPPQDPLFVTQKFPTPQNSTSPPNQWNQPYSNLQFLDPVPVMSVQMSQLVVSQEKSQHTTPDIAVKMKQQSTKIRNNTEPIDVYQLPRRVLKEDQAHRISIVEVGRTDGSTINASGDKERVLMVVGATGAGKTTLINGMANYIYGVRWESDFRFRLVDEDTAHSQAKSQTTWITAYKFHREPQSPLAYDLMIIDTPGFGDTQGIERDKQITAQIKELFSRQGENGIDHIDGIGFVAQASLARLTHSQKYIFDAILSVFGRDIGENFFVMCTFADSQKPPVLAAIEEAKLPTFDKLDKSFFRFNNSALFALNHAKEEIEEDSLEFDKMFWKMGMQSLEVFFKKLNQMNCRSLTLTKQVLDERERLEALIQGLQPKIRAGLSKMDELRQEERVLKQHETDIKANKGFVYEVVLDKQHKVDLKPGEYVTNCLKCNYTCHFPCAYSNDLDKMKCAAMDSSTKNCTVCTGKCYWENHVNNTYRFELYQEKETRTSDDLKAKYDVAKTGMFDSNTLIDTLKSDLANIQTQVENMIKQARAILKRLNEIALKPDPLNEVNYIDLLIQSEKREAKPGFDRRIQSLEKIRKNAQFMKDIADPNYKVLDYRPTAATNQPTVTTGKKIWTTAVGWFK